MEAQANITTWMKAETAPDALTVFNLLEKPKMPLSDCVQFMDGCDIIAGDIAMKDLDSVSLPRTRPRASPEACLGTRDGCLRLHSHRLPAVLGLSTLNALVAADDVIIVTEPSMFSINGFGNVYDLVESIKVDYAFNPDLNIDGILLNKYSRDEVASRAADEQLPAIAELGHTKLYAARPMKHKAIEDAANNKGAAVRFPSQRCRRGGVPQVRGRVSGWRVAMASSVKNRMDLTADAKRAMLNRRSGRSTPRQSDTVKPTGPSSLWR